MTTYPSLLVRSAFSGPGDNFQSFETDWLTGLFADSVSAVVHSHDRRIDLTDRRFVLRDQRCSTPTHLIETRRIRDVQYPTIVPTENMHVAFSARQSDEFRSFVNERIRTLTESGELFELAKKYYAPAEPPAF